MTMRIAGVFSVALLGLSAVAAADDCEDGSCDAGEADDMAVLQRMKDYRAAIPAARLFGDDEFEARRAESPCLKALSAWQELKDPPTLRGHVTLQVETAPLCYPGLRPGDKEKFWHTRAYGTPQHAPSVPGPILRAAPGETLHITLQNKLERPSPNCEKTLEHMPPLQMTWSQNGFCLVNFTNFHSHGLHVSPRRGHDDIFETVKPGEESTITLEIPRDHMPGNHWYHPHRHHATAAQAGGGMHGVIIIDDVPGVVPKYVMDMPEKIIALSVVDLRPVPTVPLDLEKTGTGSSSPQIEKWALGNLWQEGKRKDDYVTEKDVFYVLVNGMWQPRLTLEEGRWMRLRMVYASIEFTLAIDWISDKRNGLECEFQLLAKDGVYLNVAPRTVSQMYLAPGSRTDIAMRCFCNKRVHGPTCGGYLFSAATLAGDGASYSDYFDGFASSFMMKKPWKLSAKGPLAGVKQATLNQVLLLLNVKRSRRADGALRKFAASRPCYLVDLRKADVPEENKAQIVLPNTGPPFAADRTWHAVYYGAQDATDPDDFVGASMEHEKGFPPLATLKVGNVYEFLLNGSSGGGGIAQHPYHLHVTPFQIRKLRCPTGDSWVESGGCEDDAYFQSGDWQDTLMAGGGRAYVRLLTDTFTGRYVQHCHILSHEDMGMMAYFKVKGKGGKRWPGSKDIDPKCYNEEPGHFKWKECPIKAGCRSMRKIFGQR